MKSKTFYDMLDELENINSTSEKIDHLVYILKHVKNAETFFRIACGNEVYGLAEKSFYNAYNIKEEIQREYEHVSDWLKFTEYKPTAIPGGYKVPDLGNFSKDMLFTSGQDQLSKIYNFFIQLDLQKKKWFCRALLHDLRCGVKRKTINEAFKIVGLKEIEKFQMMLAGKFKNSIYDKDEVMKKIRFPCSMENKEDGIRIQAEIFQDDYSHDCCILTSRRGTSRTDDFPEIKQELLMLFSGQNLIFDGEIKAKTFNETMRKDIVSKKEYVLFDILNDENLDYRARWDNLYSLMSSIKSDIVRLVLHYNANSYEDLITFYREQLAKGEEGIIIKNDDEPYRRGKRTTMFKAKPKFTADLRITGFNYGDGKRAGKVGSISCETADSLLRVDVGSGFTDDMCTELTKQIKDRYNADFIGKIAEISYNELSQNKEGENSLRFPVFIKIRDDKDDADKFTELENR